MVVYSQEEYDAANNDGSFIRHYGTPRHSGRYPWGSGHDEDGTQRNRTLLGTYNDLRKQGLSEVQAAKGLGMTSTEVRALKTIVRNEQRQDMIHMAQQLKTKGMSNGAIAQRLREAGYKVNGESQVRALLKPSAERKTTVLDNVTNSLRKAVDEKGYIDVGSGVEYQLNTTSTMLRSALTQLRIEGYKVHNDIKLEQQTTGKMTTYKILTAGDKQWGDIMRNKDKIAQITDYSDDGGRTVLNIKPPLSISSKRVGIRYKEQGGADADGVIYVRPGVKDVELGGKRYGQVRIMVDGSHYLKGMAVYKDDLPDGVDLQFNTNKSDTGNKLDAMKKLKRLRAEGDDAEKPEKFSGPVDMDNPFGASISRQIGEHGSNDKLNKLTSVMNLVNDEGDWDKWSKSLSSQMLSKQKHTLAKEQLDHTYQSMKTQYEEISRLTNPAVKKKLLESFADGADSAAVHLKAAALPRQRTQVLLPISQMKEGEVYAPNFNDGERVALVRFPHGGTFEIPQLTVNNRNPAGIKLLGKDAIDAIGIHPKVAERLSGADFDGDTVLVIPNNLGKVRSTRALEALEGFDPKSSYPYYEGMHVMTDHEKGLEMGKISNLITDMTIQNASEDQIARAVRHSMVVIDAEKHKLDYKRSFQDNGIAALKKEYQSTSPSGKGAATLISRARSQQNVLDRKERSAKDGGPIDPKTGKKIYEATGKTKTVFDKHGNQSTVLRTIESTKLAEAEDAHTLSSGTVIESVYANHSNRLKGLANQARKASLGLKADRYSPSARETHRTEVVTLAAKIRQSIENAPLERQAQVFAMATVRQKVQANPGLRNRENKAELKRLKGQALAAARARTGADKVKFQITDAEWQAIQAGAVTKHQLDQILTYADLDRIKELATPRAELKLTPAKISRARSLHAQGYTWAEIASALGVSVSTAQKTVLGKEE